MEQYDVVVAGAGSAGVAAACAAAGSGARTLLVESTGQVGGTLAWQLLEHSAGFHDTSGRRVTAGFGQRVIDRLAGYGGTPGHIRDDVGYTATRTPVNHAELALAEATLLDDAGVTLWLNTTIAATTTEPSERNGSVPTGRNGSLPAGRNGSVPAEGNGSVPTGRDGPVAAEGNGSVRAGRDGPVAAEGNDSVPRRRIAALEACGAAGRLAVRPGVVVDCTGDGAVAALAGARVHTDGRERQPASLTVKLGGIDFAALLGYARAHPEDLRAGNVIGDDGAEHVNLWGFGALLTTGHAEGLLSFSRTEMHLAGWPRRGEAVVNVTRTPAGVPGSGWTGGALPVLARQVLELVRWFRLRVPGGAQAYVAAVADRIGVRESRRIVGEYTLTRDDVLSGARFDDAVARAAFPIDIHAADRPTLSHTEQLDRAYDLPYRCLVAAGLDNLLVAGRCLSSTHEANGSARITATCFATGEAAGVAAALSATAGTPARALDPATLRAHLTARGVLLDSGEPAVSPPGRPGR